MHRKSVSSNPLTPVNGLSPREDRFDYQTQMSPEVNKKFVKKIKSIHKIPKKIAEKDDWVLDVYAKFQRIWISE